MTRPVATRPVVMLDGRSLTCEQVRQAARQRVAVGLAEQGRLRSSAAAQVAAEVMARREVYGRTTGVGANRDQRIRDDDLAGSGLRVRKVHVLQDF